MQNSKNCLQCHRKMIKKKFKKIKWKQNWKTTFCSEECKDKWVGKNVKFEGLKSKICSYDKCKEKLTCFYNGKGYCYEHFLIMKYGETSTIVKDKLEVLKERQNKKKERLIRLFRDRRYTKNELDFENDYY